MAVGQTGNTNIISNYKSKIWMPTSNHFIVQWREKSTILFEGSRQVFTMRSRQKFPMLQEWWLPHYSVATKMQAIVVNAKMYAASFPNIGPELLLSRYLKRHYCGWFQIESYICIPLEKNSYQNKSDEMHIWIPFHTHTESALQFFSNFYENRISWNEYKNHFSTFFSWSFQIFYTHFAYSKCK